MTKKRILRWMPSVLFALSASVCLFSCDLKNAHAEISRSQADDYPLLESVEIPIDTVLFRFIAGIYVDEVAGMFYGLDVNADEQIVKFPQFRLP